MVLSGKSNLLTIWWLCTQSCFRCFLSCSH